MTLLRIVDPSAGPVTLAEVKANLRIDHSSDDDLLSSLVTAATGEVEACTGLALVSQTWRLCLDRLPEDRMARLYRHPVQSIVSVTAYDTDGTAQAIAAADWSLDANSRPARLYISSSLPRLRYLNGLEIDFAAGFGEAGPDVPDNLRRAIHLLVARWYEFRAAFGAESQPVVIPAGFDRLVAAYKLPKI